MDNQAESEELGENNSSKSTLDGEKLQFEKFKLLREEIRHEYNVTGLRVAWYLTTQTFLVFPFVSSLIFYLKNKNLCQIYKFYFSLNMLAILLSVFVFIVITASLNRIKTLHKKIGNSLVNQKNNQALGYRRENLRPEFFPELSNKIYIVGLSYPYLVALSMLLFWIVILFVITLSDASFSRCW